MFRSIYTVIFVVGTVLLLINGKILLFLLIAFAGLIFGEIVFGKGWIGELPNHCNKSQDHSDLDNSYATENTSRKQISYQEEDDTYDGFYNQRAEEYHQGYGDDFEDVIDDAWEEHKSNRKNKRR